MKQFEGTPRREEGPHFGELVVDLTLSEPTIPWAPTLSLNRPRPPTPKGAKAEPSVVP